LRCVPSGRVRTSLGPLTALTAIATTVAVAYAYAPEPPPTPADPAEPGLTRTTLISGTTPTGTNWTLTGGIDAVGSLCADLQISTSAAFFGACGMELAPVAKAELNPGAPSVTVEPSPELLLFPADLLKAVTAADPENGLGFVFGTATEEVVQVAYCTRSCLPLEVVETPTGRWFAAPVAGAEPAASAVFTATGEGGAIIDAHVRMATGPALDDCRNTNPDTISKHPTPGRHCLRDLGVNESIVGTELPLGRAATTIDVPIASRTPDTAVEVEVTAIDGTGLGAGAARFGKPAAGRLRLPLSTAAVKTLAGTMRLQARLVLRFKRQGETVRREQDVDLRVSRAG
jgi:hypothetical protein